MARESLLKYLWIIDTIKRYGRITREEIADKWIVSSVSDGSPLSRRTFYNYRNAIAELFNIEIQCDPATYEYYIPQNTHQEHMANWLLDSTATNQMITSARDVSHRIFLEEVPSAREHLATFIEALKENVQVKFDYHPYTRSLPTRGILLEPYFVKIFKQRWYVVGLNVREGKLKTYALDRVKEATLTSDKFEMPADFEPADYFTDAFGIVVTHSQPKEIVLRVDTTQAKYFRALPLHPSQHEMVTDQYSLFTYRMRVTQDLITDLLSYGPAVTVVSPPELRAAVATQLKQALANYQ